MLVGVIGGRTTAASTNIGSAMVGVSGEIPGGGEMDEAGGEEDSQPGGVLGPRFFLDRLAKSISSTEWAKAHRSLGREQTPCRWNMQNVVLRVHAFLPASLADAFLPSSLADVTDFGIARRGWAKESWINRLLTQSPFSEIGRASCRERV